MKQFKGLALAVISLILAVSLSGCIIIPLSKYYAISPEEVSSIQFYDLRNGDPSRYEMFSETCEPVHTLPEAEHKAFLEDFSELEFSDMVIIVLAAIDPSFCYGDWVVRINYANGQYTFYSCGGYGETFDVNGNCISATHFSAEDEELEALIGKYYKIK